MSVLGIAGETLSASEPGRAMQGMPLRVIIADDEHLSRERLKRFLRTEDNLSLVAECANGTEALAAIRHHQPDVAFLDVRMPELDAFGILKALRDQQSPVIILVTASEQFALQAFDFEAVDYLLKPFDRHRFQTALRRARRRLHLERGRPAESDQRETAETSPGPDRISVRSAGRILVLKISEIDWVSSSDNYVELHVGERVHLLRMTLNAVRQRLAPSRFARISRSVVVNQDRIKEIRSKSHGDFIVVLHNGTALPGSRNYRSELDELLGG